MKTFRKYLTEASKENLGYVHANIYDIIRLANDIDKLVGKFESDIEGTDANWARTVIEGVADKLNSYKKELENIYKKAGK